MEVEIITYSIIQKSQLEGALRLDAEYYQPKYLELIDKIQSTNSYKKWGNIEGSFITGPFGSEFNVENYTQEEKYRYVRGKDVKEFFLLENDNVYIPEKDFKRLKKYSLQEGDILLSVVGTLGNTAVLTKSCLPAIFSCKSTAFRSDTINNFYFIAYLNSKYGRNLLLRSARGQIQTGLNIEDLKALPVFIPNEYIQKRIAGLIKKAKTSLDIGKLYYQKAENLLLEELGLKDYQIKDELFYVVNFSKVKEAQRLDAEYFQPKYNNLISKLKSKNSKLLSELIIYKKGVEPGGDEYQETGNLFIRVSSLSKQGLTDKDQKYLSNELYEKLKKEYQPQVGEILLTKDANPGIAYYLSEQAEGIISGGILRLILKNDINPEYLVICINSIIGRMQVERDAGGSVISHWKPEQIKNLLIPILPQPIQQKIANLVKKSHEARKKSKELLELAKRKVEEMIEKGNDA